MHKDLFPGFHPGADSIRMRLGAASSHTTSAHSAIPYPANTHSTNGESTGTGPAQFA